MFLILIKVANSAQYVTDAYVDMKTIYEIEENKTETKTILPLQTYLIGKTIKESFYVGLSASFDNSERSYINKELGIDTVLKTKYMDNYLIKLNWNSGSNRVYTHVAYSATEEKMTSYGAAWSYSKLIGTNRIGGALRTGYDYFYHWTNSGRDYGGLNLNFNRARFNLELDYERTLVRSAERYEIITLGDTLWSSGTNGGIIIGAGCGFLLFKKTGLRLDAKYEYSDYRFGSLRFYATNDRQLIYGGLSVDDKFHRLIYSGTVHAGYDDGGRERDGKEIDSKLFWKAGASLGWDFGFMIVSANASLFSNAVYQSEMFGTKIVIK
jgi:hypothetical protein